MVDIPVSLAEGVIRTKEFGSKNSETYSILIRARRRLPFADLSCMMGLDQPSTPPYYFYENCKPVLRADWWILENGKVVTGGSTREGLGGGTTNGTMDRYLGHFTGQAGHRYVLEVRFTADGTPLNVTNPHLIVKIIKPSD